MSRNTIVIASIEGIIVLLVVIVLVFASQPTDAGKSTLLTTSLYRESLAADIRSAEQFVYGTTYLVEAYPDNPILIELEAANKRGVEVRLMFDYRTLEDHPTISKDLEERKIPYKVISGHSKVAVIDNKIAYIGSSNWNRNGLEKNWELNLRTNIASTVSEAHQFVDVLWEQGRKPVVYKDVSPERMVNGKEFYDLLIEELKGAESIKLLNYGTSYDYANSDAIDSMIFDLLVDAHNRGTKLQIVIDDSKYLSWSSARDLLVDNKIPHKLDEPGTEHQILHAKAYLIDDEVLFIGSHNLDEDSLLSSQQISVMTTDRQTISDFLVIFEEKFESSIDTPDDREHRYRLIRSIAFMKL